MGCANNNLAMARVLLCMQRMKTNSTILIASLMAVLLGSIGCSSDSDNDALVVGDWVDQPAGERLAINDDGTFTFDGTESVTGTYSVDGDYLTLAPDTAEQPQVTTSFYANDDVLAMEALIADSTVDGLVGTWTGGQTITDATFTMVLQLASDGSAVYTVTVDESPIVTETTYSAAGNTLTFGAESGMGPLTIIDGVALSERMFTRE